MKSSESPHLKNSKPHPKTDFSISNCNPMDKIPWPHVYKKSLFSKQYWHSDGFGSRSPVIRKPFLWGCDTSIIVSRGAVVNRTYGTQKKQTHLPIFTNQYLILFTMPPPAMGKALRFCRHRFRQSRAPCSCDVLFCFVSCVILLYRNRNTCANPFGPKEAQRLSGYQYLRDKSFHAGTPRSHRGRLLFSSFFVLLAFPVIYSSYSGCLFAFSCCFAFCIPGMHSF